jgi:hypothetical protein
LAVGLRTDPKKAMKAKMLKISLPRPVPNDLWC